MVSLALWWRLSQGQWQKDRPVEPWRFRGNMFSEKDVLGPWETVVYGIHKVLLGCYNAALNIKPLHFMTWHTSVGSVLSRCWYISPFCCDTSLCSCDSRRVRFVPVEICASFSQRANPLLLDALRCGLYLIFGKVCDPLSAMAAQAFSGHMGSVCVAWLVVALCSRTEIRWAEPVISVMDFPSRSELDDGDRAGNVNTSSSSVYDHKVMRNNGVF